jgi:hypothetical protein
MTNPLTTDLASRLFQGLQLQAKSVLSAFNEHDFPKGQETVSGMRKVVAGERATLTEADEAYLNEFYVLDRYVDFLGAYGGLWEKILKQQFAASWCSLQDALGLLRLIKRFSEIDISFFESQLTELEHLYPYNVFFSVGMVVERFECSICGFDIDSDECVHMQGHLYGGRMATAIVQNCVRFDHASLVTNPANKRCVVQYEDTDEQFNVIRHLSNFIASKRCQISYLWSVRFSKRRLPNSEYRKIGRNERCFCGSGKKFKKCCMGKAHVEADHVDIIAHPRSIDAAIA